MQLFATTLLLLLGVASKTFAMNVPDSGAPRRSYFAVPASASRPVPVRSPQELSNLPPINYHVYNPATGEHYSPATRENGYRDLALHPLYDRPEHRTANQQLRNSILWASPLPVDLSYSVASNNAKVKSQALMHLAPSRMTGGKQGAIFSEADGLVLYHDANKKSKVEKLYNKNKLPTLKKDAVGGTYTLEPPKKSSRRWKLF